jgi:pimeloyl-ACP methyl ester carboxylesterase
VHRLPRLPLLLALLCLPVAPGCASWRQGPLVDYRPPFGPDAHAIVYVADGAGNFRAMSSALRKAVVAEKLPLYVKTFEWSHGYGRVLADQVDHGHVRSEGQRLADLIRARRQAYPESPIYLVAHSAGSGVVLAAAERLPPGQVDRIILLAPSVPSDYDLRPALHAVKDELDVFCSIRDNSYLRMSDLVTSLFQCKWCAAAGCHGFQSLNETPDDVACYAKLRQYPWEPRLAWTGHEGGHFGCYQQGYLRAFVLPLLARKQGDTQTEDVPAESHRR